MFVVFHALAALCLVSQSKAERAATAYVARNNDVASQSFVTTKGNQFFLDNKPFNFAGTDAYWLPMLNSTENVQAVLQSIKESNLTVVRMW